MPIKIAWYPNSQHTQAISTTVASGPIARARDKYVRLWDVSVR